MLMLDFAQRSNMFELKHPNVVKIFGISPTPKHELIIEWYPKDLLEVYKPH